LLAACVLEVMTLPLMKESDEKDVREMNFDDEPDAVVASGVETNQGVMESMTIVVKVEILTKEYLQHYQSLSM